MTDGVAFDIRSAQRIDDTVSIVLGSRREQTTGGQSSDGQSAVVAKPVDLLRKLEWMTSTFDVTMYSIDGDVWKDDAVVEPIRIITNGLQIAVPVSGAGLAVQDSAFWAVNVGTLAAPTLTITGTPKIISGASVTGNAAVLDVMSDGKLKVTTRRLKFVRWDDGGTIADGTLIQLAYVSGSLTCVHANCGPKAGLTGLPANP